MVQLRLAVGAPHQTTLTLGRPSCRPSNHPGLGLVCGRGLIRGWARPGYRCPIAQVAAVAVHEFEVVAEHADQVLLQPHQQRVHPGVEDHVGPLKTHLRGIAGRHILHMQGRADHGAGDAQALGAVALHLGAEHQLGSRLGNCRFHRQVVVADQRLQAQLPGGGAHLTGLLAAVAAQAHHLEAQLAAGDAGGGDGVAGVAEHEHPLAGEVGGIHRARVPGQARAPFRRAHPIAAGHQLRRQVQAEHAVQLAQEGHGGADADRHRVHCRDAELALQPAAHRGRHLRVEVEVGVGRGDAHQVGRAGTQRGHHGHIDAVGGQQLADLAHVVAAAEAQQRGAQQVHPRPAAFRPPAAGIRFGGAGRRQLGFEQATHQLVEGFGGAPVLLLGVGGQLQAHHRNAAQVHAGGQGTGLVLDQLGGAALAHQQGLGLEALHRLGDRALHQLGCVTAQIPGLEGGVGDRGALVPPLDHREQQVGVGVALGRMQHVVHPLHRGGDAHGTHVRRAFVGPEGEFHRERCRRGSGEK